MLDKPDASVLRLLERLPVTIVISDVASGTIVWANLRDLHIIAAESPSAVIGRNLLEFIDASQQGTAIRDLEAVARGETPPPVVYRIRRVDGGYAHVHIASVPTRFEGQPAILSCITDITDREELVRDLSESEGRYRELVESSPNGIVVVLGTEIVYANPALAETLGVADADALAGRKFLDFVDPRCHEQIRKARRKMLRTGEPHPANDVVLVAADGSTLDAMAVSTTIRWSGEPATQTVLHFRGAREQEPSTPEPEEA